MCLNTPNTYMLLTLISLLMVRFGPEPQFEPAPNQSEPQFWVQVQLLTQTKPLVWFGVQQIPETGEPALKPKSKSVLFSEWHGFMYCAGLAQGFRLPDQTLLQRVNRLPLSSDLTLTGSARQLRSLAQGTLNLKKLSSNHVLGAASTSPHTSLHWHHLGLQNPNVFVGYTSKAESFVVTDRVALHILCDYVQFRFNPPLPSPNQCEPEPMVQFRVQPRPLNRTNGLVQGSGKKLKEPNQTKPYHHYCDLSLCNIMFRGILRWSPRGVQNVTRIDAIAMVTFWIAFVQVWATSFVCLASCGSLSCMCQAAHDLTMTIMHSLAQTAYPPLTSIVNFMYKGWGCYLELTLGKPEAQVVQWVNRMLPRRGIDLNDKANNPQGDMKSFNAFHFTALQVFAMVSANGVHMSTSGGIGSFFREVNISLTHWHILNIDLLDWHSFFMQGNNYLNLMPTFGPTAIQISILHNSPAYPLLTNFPAHTFLPCCPWDPTRDAALTVCAQEHDGLTNMPPFLVLVNYLTVLFALQLPCSNLEDSEAKAINLGYLLDLLFQELAECPLQLCNGGETSLPSLFLPSSLVPPSPSIIVDRYMWPMITSFDSPTSSETSLSLPSAIPVPARMWTWTAVFAHLCTHQLAFPFKNTPQLFILCSTQETVGTPLMGDCLVQKPQKLVCGEQLAICMSMSRSSSEVLDLITWGAYGALCMMWASTPNRTACCM
ncbi:hypothetical protein EDB85DRAFT_1891677 [Lactarius pseudohatsudake]|nr:hypothetical protein EDB85DRAFT_1891677 [Lactarius pseudohatsudake]